MRGFGFQVDIVTGTVRRWYSGPDGVQKWADNDQPCSYTAHLAENFDKLFGDIPPPDEIAPLETAEGMCGLPECGCVDGCEFGGCGNG
jgi:hypothetical protein